jgi:hypothetical protein
MTMGELARSSTSWPSSSEASGGRCSAGSASSSLRIAKVLLCTVFVFASDAGGGGGGGGDDDVGDGDDDGVT